ncbi:hypothetical protein CCMA1212_000840 [Trichoderma ghanense]|uniref:Uncharacterized protein n=1 Tax=Trichoderma ghanense TaxID=65468 RepID=A0ABY2HF25_9HYPO
MSPSRRRVLSGLRPSKPEHLSRLLHVLELLGPPFRQPGRDGSQIGPPASERRLPGLDLVSGGLDLVAQLIGGGQDLVRLVLRGLRASDGLVPGVLAWPGALQEIVDLRLERVALEHDLQVLHAAVVDLVPGVYGAQERTALGVVRAVADVAFHVGGQLGGFSPKEIL